MAAPKENLPSLGRLNCSEKNTFTKERQFCGNKRVMHLQQRWQELKEREYTAQQQNRQLLQQFEKAQDTLKEMLARNAAMKMIRMEYERYLEENSPRWQQQLKEKRQAAQKKKMDDYLKSCLKNTDVMKSSAGPPTEPQKTATPQGYSDYNQDDSSHLPHTQSSWLSRSQSQIARFPTRVPPIIPHPYPLYYPASAPGQYHHPWHRQDLQGRASLQPDYPWYQPAGATGTPSYSEALWGQLYMAEPLRDSRVSQTVGEDDKMSRVLSSQRERSVRSSSSRSSLELDVKPVRLSSSHSESSESGKDSSKKVGKEKGGRKQRVSSDRERCSPQELSGNSSAIHIPSVKVAQSSESNASSEKSLRSSRRRTKRSGDLSVQSPGSQKEAEERTASKGGDSESQDTGEESGSLNEAYEGEKAGNQNHEEKTNRCKESGSQREKESESDSAKNKNNDASEVEEQDSSSAEQSTTGEKVEDKTEEDLEAKEDGEEKEKSQTDKEQDDSDIKQGDGASAKDATEEEAETSTDDEMEEQGGEEQSIRLKDEGSENRKQGAASSQDKEDESEGSEEEDEDLNQQEDDESEEEHGSEEDQIDSDDCIVTPQEKRPTQIITEEAAQEQEEGKTGSDNDDPNKVGDEDDIENLLAPQEETQQKENYLRGEEKPKASFHNMGIFQVEHNKSKTEEPNDSDEFDHFYD
ncbi:17S U2 SnRNP complex component HTATSF1 isoform X2 [Pelmatolapia mariae]|uniref:17S U2 SnRNP complex component HTATSF1 isoform X2 n=1 Tax=Pelmatolapia mariae TaxID=158779 RepID=UPI002FE5F3F9